MFEEISKKLQDNIRLGMKNNFGLTEAESEQSISILFEKFKTFFSEGSMKENIENIRDLVQDKLADSNNPIKEKFNTETINELIDKVGLNKETAKKVKDFSFDQYVEQIKESFAGLEDKLDISSVIEKIKPENIEGNAKELLENFGKFFDSKKK